MRQIKINAYTTKSNCNIQNCTIRVFNDKEADFNFYFNNQELSFSLPSHKIKHLATALSDEDFWSKNEEYIDNTRKFFDENGNNLENE